MSWNFKFVGKDKSKIKDEIMAQQYCPPGFREALCELIETRDMTPQSVGKVCAVHVESDGHFDTKYGYGKFTCSVVTLVE